MNKKELIIAWSILLCLVATASAYMENYPPYKFKNGPFKHLKAELLVDHEHPEYKSKDGQVLIRIKNVSDFILQVGRKVLVKNGEEAPMPYAAYWTDVDKNGFKDFMVFYQWGASSLAGGQVDLLLNKDGKSYQKIIYDTIRAGLEDFVDLNNDGRYEVIITGIYAGNKHNYFTYNIYEIKDYKLVNSNVKFNGFPKFIWMTNNPNDKDTVHLTKEERVRHVKEIDNGIKYKEIK